MKIRGALRIVIAFALAATAIVFASSASADVERGQRSAPYQTPALLKGLDVEEHLGGSLPLGAMLRDADGEPVELGAYFDHKRPVLLVFAYHTCPMLCSMVLDGIVDTAKELKWTVGAEFDVLSISIDPRDTPESASKKRAQIVEKYARGEGDRRRGWHFLVGDEGTIKTITDAVGFEYRYDPEQQQYAHPAAIYLVSPDGKLARYLYGIKYDAQDVKLGLLEASEGRSISTIEKILFYCYHYDPKSGKYTVFAMNVMRIGGALTAVLLGGLLAILWRRERKKRRLATTRDDDDERRSPAHPNPKAASADARP